MCKSIMLVDDEHEVVTFLGNFLKRLNISSIQVTSGEDALLAYDKDKIDFVFLDVQLKGIDGIDVLKGLKKINPDARVVMITGKAEKSYQDMARELGAIDYITKPLDLGELREKINKYLIQ
ncbi:MAG TPA: response regulator [Elusimicrobia bacterium]|nr:MAG: hypothetical protein A2278_00725 [Elusimicrobia bacterium RIFOXYA12_FULL_49_49]OGS09959.1 MAG: hypothetical protein A2204_05980 [Elusimicrobia bacterium RIFOXYA1_FULL_47_7]OGS15180.1 MAG: hypothetical protein A2251_00735 [Elusimicrobia bacterium RIFOXYA2_FULL_47_53]OGS26950.1 MAG: hypothetical protein A2339_01455 [Elusimicrobia bacterium RIFOXYB12_FULL_50_12]OGS29800.1 MAG: hypothetical protein A2323_01535 [Elusimicrobia bacterium RIFOXYB2_FULL_46_23]HBU70283.1 response regulator [Elus